MAIKIHQQMAEARARGIGWPEIDDFLGDKQAKASEAGFFPLEIADHMGYADPQRLRDRMEAEAMVSYSMAD